MVNVSYPLPPGSPSSYEVDSASASAAASEMALSMTERISCRPVHS